MCCSEMLITTIVELLKQQFFMKKKLSWVPALHNNDTAF